MSYSARPISTQFLAVHDTKPELYRTREVHRTRGVREDRSGSAVEPGAVHGGAPGVGGRAEGRKMPSSDQVAKMRESSESGKVSTANLAQQQVSDVTAAAQGDTASPAWAGYNSLGVLIQASVTIGNKVNNMV